MKKTIYFLCAISGLSLMNCKKTPLTSTTAPKNQLTFKANSGYGSLSIIRNDSTIEYSDIDDKAVYSKSFPDVAGDYQFIMTSVAAGHSWLEIYHNDTLVARQALVHTRRVNLKTTYQVK